MNRTVRTSQPPTPAERSVTRAFEDVGAITPATARPLDEIPGLDPIDVVPLAARGVIREAWEDHFYLYTSAQHQSRQWMSGKMLLVLVIIALLVLPLLFLRGRPF